MEQASGMIIVYTTLPSESEARKLGAELVEERLAACVNIFPGMISIYRWEDTIETGQETAMLVKTAKALETKILQTIARRHPYSVPALIVLEPGAVAPSYLEWLLNQTGPAMEI